jgi:DNA-binding transcriptional LysR family regulator
MPFGTRWVAPILPDFFRRYPDISVDMDLSDDGFDAALRGARAGGIVSRCQAIGARWAVHRRYPLYGGRATKTEAING